MNIKRKFSGAYKTNKGNWVIPIQKDGLTVKIRETPGYNVTRWTVSWKEKGKPIRKTSTDLDLAVQIANGAIIRTFEGQTKHANMLGRDGKEYDTCKQIAESYGYTLNGLVKEWAQCQDKLNRTASLPSAVDSYLLNSYDQIKPINIPEAISLFLDDKVKDTSLKEYKMYETQLGEFAEAFDCRAKDIQASDIRNHIESKTIKRHFAGKGKVGEPIGNATKRNTLKRILTFFIWMQNNNYLPLNKQNAAAKLSALIKRKNNRIWKDQEKQIPVFSIDQTKRIIKECDEDLIAYAAISLFAGMRSSEVLNLEWSDIDFERGYIEYTRYDSKTLKNRWILLHDNLRSILEPIKGTYPKSRRKRSRKICLDSSAKLLSKNLKKLGIIKIWKENIMRHSYASYRQPVIKDIAALATELGDTPDVVKNHYRKPFPEEEGIQYFSIGL